jgi:hypothetical protein
VATTTKSPLPDRSGLFFVCSVVWNERQIMDLLIQEMLPHDSGPIGRYVNYNWVIEFYVKELADLIYSPEFLKRGGVKLMSGAEMELIKKLAV